jgi:two-component system, NtrC family, sensor kinase
METETRRTGRIVSNLLAFSRQSKMEMKSVNINRLIEQTLLINANLFMIAGVKIEKHLCPDLPDSIGSEDQLLQVFMNLVSNAAQAMESCDGGVLRIQTDFSSKPNAILIQIADTGVGIPEKDMSRLFEPFFTTRKGKGVGLGLSVAYGIIQEHGGSIYVQSKIGEGTTFHVKLPVRSSIDEASREGGQRELR